MEILSLIGIFAGLGLMVFLTYKGHSIIWVAPLSAIVVVLFALGAGLGTDRTLLSSYTVDYMRGAGEYFISWFPVFLLGAIYGKVMDVTGAAKALADIIIKIFGARFAVLAVVIPCMILTYGGVSLFVVVFIMYPMGCAIYKAADIPRTYLPAAIAFGSFGITMTSIPGSPQIQNLIPMEYFGTSATAAPVLGIIASLLAAIPGYIYLDMKVRKAKKEGKGFSSGVKDISVTGEQVLGSEQSSSNKLTSVAEKKASSDTNRDISKEGNSTLLWLSGLIPLIVVFISLNVLKWNVIIAVLLGIVVCCLFNIKKIRYIPYALSEGAKGSITAIMNTACAVGFGSVIRVVPGFILLTGLLIGTISSPVQLFFSEAISSAVLSGATGSASGGLSIALEAFSDHYMAAADSLGISYDMLHRIAAIAAGSLDKLPHNGVVITLLAVSECTHRQSYKDI